MFSLLLNLVLLPFKAVGTAIASVLALVMFGITMLVIPPFGKRLILTMSLYAHLRELDAHRASSEQVLGTIRELVALLGISPKSERSLMLPVLIAEYIWDQRQVPVQQVLGSSHTAPWSCERIMGATPRWLRYDREQMRRDIMSILTGCRQKIDAKLPQVAASA